MAVIREYGLVLVGLHMHIGSGVDYRHLEEVCGAMVGAVRDLGCDLEAISAGGGLSIPYRENDPAVDIPRYAELWNLARREIEGIVQHPVRLELEPGRFLVAESGCLLSEVRAVKDVGNNHFILVDAGFNDLMRPSMYGSFHGMSLLDADGNPSTAAQRETVVAGPLCESGDVFTQHDGGLVAPRVLPAAQVGDLLLIHDTGAYGASMSSNYNSRPLLPEVLVDGDEVRLIRRRQPLADLLALEQF
ncbi:Diaminopimelate decarboxylase [compost metagenome]